MIWYYQIKVYIRDKRSPVPKSEAVSRVMSANCGKNTNPELAIRKALWKQNIRGYRLHVKKLPGKPDIVFSGLKLAIFVHGCFWHRCPSCNYSLPKTNVEYWKTKFCRNVERDKRHLEMLKASNWDVLVVWECEIKRSPDEVVKKIVNAVQFARKNLSRPLSSSVRNGDDFVCSC